MELAEKTLKGQEVLILKMTDFLSDNRQLYKHQANIFLKRYIRDFDLNSLIDNGDLLFYRVYLNKKLPALML